MGIPGDLNSGAMSDAVGLAHRKLVREIFGSVSKIDEIRAHHGVTVEALLVNGFFNVTGHRRAEIVSITAKDQTGSGPNGGPTKGMIKFEIENIDGSQSEVTATVKASSADRVSVAEFSARTIASSIGLTDPETIKLMEKHQRDCSAKHFSDDEKLRLTEGLKSYRRKLAYWAMTGSSSASSGNSDIPSIAIRFLLADNEGVPWPHFAEVLTMEDMVSRILQSSAGFGTGFSWTYATGTAGEKIQLKGPV